MLNLRMLYILLDKRSVKTYLALVTSLGFGVLLDIMIFLNLTLLIGPWITLAILASITAVGVAFVFPYVEKSGVVLLTAVDDGHFDAGILSRYIATLIAAGFIIVPGLFNTMLGCLLLLKPLGTRAGDLISRLTGIDWQEAYEYLRLDRMTRNSADS